MELERLSGHERRTKKASERDSKGRASERDSKGRRGRLPAQWNLVSPSKEFCLEGVRLFFLAHLLACFLFSLLLLPAPSSHRLAPLLLFAPYLRSSSFFFMHSFAVFTSPHDLLFFSPSPSQFFQLHFPSRAIETHILFTRPPIWIQHVSTVFPVSELPEEG